MRRVARDLVPPLLRLRRMPHVPGGVQNPVPGVVALRDSERPDTIVTMAADQWATLTDAVKAGEFDLSA